MLIHQALHGYNQGHNRIACSMPLLSADDDRMKILSDWSGYSGDTVEDYSYISAYPLTDGKSYVVAKTWYADEMNRPGCVWTHSLILDIQNIEKEFDFRTLQKLFRRPSDNNFEGYDSTLTINKENILDNTNFIFKTEIVPLLKLYVQILKQNNGVAYMVEKTSDFYQTLLLSYLQFLPLQLLHKISFCSGSSLVRKIDSNLFNIQFTTSAGKSLFYSPELNSLKESNFNEGLIYIVKSLKENNRETSQLIRIFSSDLGDNPSKTCALGILLNSLDKIDSNIEKHEYEKIISVLQEAFPNKDDGNLLKQKFLGERIALLFTTKEEYYYKICTMNDSAFDWTIINVVKDIHKYISSSFENLVHFLNRLIHSDSLNTLGKIVIKNEADYMDKQYLTELSENNWNIYIILLSFNSSLLLDKYWLELPENKIEYLLPKFSEMDLKSFTYWSEILNTSLTKNIEMPDIILNTLYNNKSNCISIIMNHVKKMQHLHIPESLIRLCQTHSTDILKWMNEQTTISISNVRLIIKTIKPDSLETKNYGSNPWHCFANIDDDYCDINYYIFIFLLSFNWKDALSLDMMKRSFYQIYECLSKDELTLAEINKFEKFMGELPFWQNWDNCKKFCKGVTKHLKQMKYERATLMNFTPSKSINERMLKIWDKI